MHDGHNLFDIEASYGKAVWDVHTTLMPLKHNIKNIIVWESIVIPKTLYRIFALGTKKQSFGKGRFGRRRRRICQLDCHNFKTFD